MHNLRALELLALPKSVRSRPLAALELSIDFYPRGAPTPEAAHVLMADCFEVLFRRLAPWKSGLIRNLVRASGGRRQIRNLYEEPAPMWSASGELLIPGWAPGDHLGRAFRPELIDGRVRSETIYYDKPIEESWAHYQIQPEPGAQVKLYYKTTDCGQELPASQWRVRVEVTLNGAALAQRGVHRLEDIDQTALTAITGEFILLGRVVATELRSPRRRRKNLMGDWMARELHRRHQHSQARAIELASTEGMVATMPRDDLLRFKTAPALMNMVRVPVADFFKPQRRARAGSMGKIAGQITRSAFADSK